MERTRLKIRTKGAGSLDKSGLPGMGCREGAKISSQGRYDHFDTPPGWDHTGEKYTGCGRKSQAEFQDGKHLLRKQYDRKNKNRKDSDGKLSNGCVYLKGFSSRFQRDKGITASRCDGRGCAAEAFREGRTVNGT